MKLNHESQHKITIGKVFSIIEFQFNIYYSTSNSVLTSKIVII